MVMSSYRPWKVPFASVPVLMCVSIAGVLAQSGTKADDPRAVPSKNFPLAGGNYLHQRYSALDQINATNIKQLGAAWMIHVDEGGPGGQLQGTPVVIDGVMYVTTGAANALAIDAATGETKWRYRPESSVRMGGNQGVTVGEGKVFFGRR